MAIENLDAMLQKAFDESTKIYQQRGFQRRIGFGRKPALISVDLANAWTRPGNPFTCDQQKMDEDIIPGMQRLLEACRKNGHVIVHVTTAYQNTDRNDPASDMGMWHHKIPVEAVNLTDEHLWAIDSRIAPIKGEYVLMKKRERFQRHAARWISPLLWRRHHPGHRGDRHGLHSYNHLRRFGRWLSNDCRSRVHSADSRPVVGRTLHSPRAEPMDYRAKCCLDFSALPQRAAVAYL